MNNKNPLFRILPFALACWPGLAQPSLQYVSADSTAQARVFAADSSGNIFTVFNVVEPSGRPQMRVIKTSAQGTVLGTFDFGGSYGDTPSGAATDSQGNLVIAGTTGSTDFPTVSPVVTATDQVVAFVVKINAQLTQILFSTRLGGSSGAVSSGGLTTGNAVATDGAGNIYVTGNTFAPDFPVTPGAFQTTGGDYAFATEIAAAGNKLVFSTYYGGNLTNCTGGSACIGAAGGTTGNAIAVDAGGAIVIAGNTSANNLPVTAGTPGQTCVCGTGISGPQSAGFVAEFFPGGSQLAWATYVNTSVGELGSINVRAVAFDASANVIIGGSSPIGLITTTNAVQAADPGSGSPSVVAGFMAKYSANGQRLLFSTYMGGNSTTTIQAVPGVASLVVDSQSGIWATGSCAPAYLPLPSGSPLLGTNYVVDLSSDGTKLLGGFAVPAGAAGLGLLSAAQGEIAALGASGSILTVAAGQTPAIAGIVNSAGFQVSGQVAAYELISLYGNGIGSSTQLNGQVANGVLGTSLGGVKVTFDGFPAPLLYVGPNQINAVVPGEIAEHATTQLQVTLTNGSAQALTLFVVSSQPEIFATAANSQIGQTTNMAIALNQDGSVNSLANPAAAGSIVAVWATGAGGYGLERPDGGINGTTALQQPGAPISIVSRSDSLEVLYGGDAPDLVTGVIQINFQLPTQVLPVEQINSTTAIVDFQWQAGDFTSGLCGIYMKAP